MTLRRDSRVSKQSPLSSHPDRLHLLQYIAALKNAVNIAMA
jgi:hypothetical protein